VPALCLVFAAGVALGAALDAAFDPARLAPHIYKVLLQNERLRVLDVTLRNGETPPLHRHPDRLIVYLNSCAWMETGSDGKETMQSYTTGDVVWKPALMHGGERSKVVHDCRQLDIELLETVH
jgi:quercetin dioxygenase-like cupin family protein